MPAIPAFNIDSWFWKIVIVGAILLVREFVRFFAPNPETQVAQPAGAGLSKPRSEKAEHDDTSKWLIETLDSAAVAIGLVLFVIQPFILQAFYIPSGSMENTLQVRDRLLVSKLIYRLRDPRFQDVVVFKAPKDALLTSDSPEGTDFIKRAIGTPGDVIYVVNRQLYRNGAKIAEPYTKWSDTTTAANLPSINPAAPDAFVGAARDSYDMKIVDGVVYSRGYGEDGEPGLWTRANVPIENQDEVSAAPNGAVPPGQILVLGDHRNNSNDGHVWGFVPRENIVGKAVCVFWPPTRLGLVEKMSQLPQRESRPIIAVR